MRNSFRRICAWYVRFAEKQGFPIIVTVCVGMITATALWTGRAEPTYVSPTPPVGQSVSAAQLLQQSLKVNTSSTPMPEKATPVWQSPLQHTTVLRAYSQNTFCQGSTTGVWQLHDAVDLACTPGDKVCTIADGRIIDCGQNDILGVWFSVDHGEGIQALYAGMALSGAYLPGDEIKAGTTIGFAGKGPVDEQDLPAHLHLKVTQNGCSIDPISLWGR